LSLGIEIALANRGTNPEMGIASEIAFTEGRPTE
jgi:hypothetical protein